MNVISRMSISEFGWIDWLARFRVRAALPPRGFEGPVGLSAFRKDLLARSIAVFQLGEAGEGRLAAEIQVFGGPFINDSYKQACSLFVREEGRHALELLLILRFLGHSPLQKSRANTAFVSLRRMLGIKTKLFVLLIAEVVGVVFYSSLAFVFDESNEPALADAFSSISLEEIDHLIFHLDFFIAACGDGQPNKIFISLAFALSAMPMIVWASCLHSAAFEHRFSFAMRMIKSGTKVVKASLCYLLKSSPDYREVRFRLANCLSICL